VNTQEAVFAGRDGSVGQADEAAGRESQAAIRTAGSPHLVLDIFGYFAP